LPDSGGVAEGNRGGGPRAGGHAEKNNHGIHRGYRNKMAAAAAFVTEVILEQYPDLNIPYHSRWRHFEAGSHPRINQLLENINSLPSQEQGRILYELAILSVLLDAGAGNQWQFVEAETQEHYTRSEGLAIASLSMYRQGAFSSVDNNPLRADASALIHLNDSILSNAFQVTKANPLAGVSGRVNLLNRLGNVVGQHKVFFGDEARLGNFFDYICSLVSNKKIEAALLFQSVLTAFNKIWPTRLEYAGQSLGDVWIHSALTSSIPGSEYIPFHKLSQWLTYSLIEPLEHMGIEVIQLDALTGLPEYRNGGLLIDFGILELIDPTDSERLHEPGSELIVEWRALTVALLDELADLVRANLQKNQLELPLAKILQGGTWEAGRRIARKKRPHGTPPLNIVSDGTVF